MARDSSATKRRLLDAGRAEFAARGLAGARVDRIAAAGAANKQLIYAYFGSKEGLFDAVMLDVIGSTREAVPFRADDLAAYAGALFDEFQRRPDTARLVMWRRLERPAATQAEVGGFAARADEIAEALNVDRVTALDLYVLTMSVITGWGTAPDGVREIGAEAGARWSRYRELLVRTVASAVDAALEDAHLPRA